MIPTQPKENPIPNTNPSLSLTPLKAGLSSMLVIKPRGMFWLILTRYCTSYPRSYFEYQSPSRTATMSQLSSLTRSSIPSPLTTQLPTLSPSQIASLPYPPDLYPGARDVKTSYGTMRVYEWGHENGRKVMLVHGDATSAPVWKRVAAGLVAKGCRVIVVGRSTFVFCVMVSHTCGIRRFHGKPSLDAVVFNPSGKLSPP
jgi:hypothetical protein